MSSSTNGMSSSTKEDLERQLQALSLRPNERAALLLDLAELVGAEDPAAYMQQVYELRLKSVAEAIQGSAGLQGFQQLPDNTASSSQSPPRAAAARFGAGAEEPGASNATAGTSHKSNSSSGSSSADSWDASDDWEPNVSCLRSASSFEEKQRERPAALLQPFQSSPHPQGLSAGAVGSPQRSRFALSEPNASIRASSSGGGSSGAGSRPRGRGQSKCGLPTSDSEDEALLIAAQSQPHIVEVYGLTRSVSTTHLENFLLDFIWGTTAPNIKWVDDEHALAVFPCAEAAQVLLDAPQRTYKVRPYSKASKGALHIASEELTPPRSARPKTTTAVARRLISNALGNREVRDKAAEKELAELRKANKQERKERQEQLDAAWGEDG